VTQCELFKEDEFRSSINVFHSNILEPRVTLEPHRHENEEQVFSILGGSGVVTVGGQRRNIKEGDAIYLPPRLTHSMKNTGSHPLRFLAVGAKIGQARPDDSRAGPSDHRSNSNESSQRRP